MYAAVALCALAAHASPVEAQPPLLEPTILREDFQGDGLGQFASYPPAQDIGYEPSLAPTAAFDAPGGRALMRVVRPTATGPLQIGLIRQTDLVMASGAALAFEYRIETPEAAATLEIGVAGADGKRYVRRLQGTSGGWQSAEVRLDSLVAGSAGARMPADTGIEAVYVIAGIADASPDVTYRFLIDNVRLSARRAARFDLRQPGARAVAAGAALTAARGYATGDAIAIEADGPVPLTSVTCTLRAPDGTQVAAAALSQNGPPPAGGARWGNPAVHTLRADDPRGIWSAVLDGRTTDGRRVLTRVRFLVERTPVLAHPRLYFSAGDRERLRDRRRHPAMAKLWNQIEAAAKASRASGPIAHGGEVFARLDREFLLPSLLGYFDVLNRARARVANNALVAWVNDDQEAFEAAKRAMLDVAAWRRWEPPWFTANGQHTYYPAGLLAAAVAFGYDLLHDRLTEEERATIRRALLERAILPTWREYVLDNRAMANTSNWISHTVGGAILAALAIHGDGGRDERAALHLPLNGLLIKIEAHMAASFLPDGSYGEGISYLEFDLDTLGPMLHAAERVLGQPYWSSTHVLGSLAYPLHTLAVPPSESLDQGDTHPPAGHGIAPVVYRSTDPVIRWYGRRFEPRTMYDFIFFNEDVEPRAPEGEGSRLFDDKGNAVFRSGWNEEDAILLFRAGPTFNHNHNDQGSFLLRNFGELLVSEAGWSDYYKDPYYATFFTQAIGHSTLLVDGHPESQVIADTPQFAALDEYPRITDFVSSAFYDAVGSELASVYPRLSNYTRRLAFLKPDLLVVFDRVRAPQAARYNVLFHVPDLARASAKGSAGRFEGQRAALALRTFASAPVDVSLRQGRIPYPVLAARTPPEVPPQPGFFDVETTSAATDAWVISALAMRPQAADAEALAASIVPVQAPGWAGLRVDRGARKDAVLFRQQRGEGPLAYERWTTDGDAFVTSEAPETTRFGVQQATVVRQGARTLLSSSVRLDAALSIAPAGVEVHARTTDAAELRLFVPQRPARVRIGPTPAAAGSWRYAGQMLAIEIPAGQTHITVEMEAR